MRGKAQKSRIRSGIAHRCLRAAAMEEVLVGRCMVCRQQDKGAETQKAFAGMDSRVTRLDRAMLVSTGCNREMTAAARSEQASTEELAADAGGEAAAPCLE